MSVVKTLSTTQQPCLLKIIQQMHKSTAGFSEISRAGQLCGCSEIWYKRTDESATLL